MSKNKWNFETICSKELEKAGRGTPHVLPLMATSAFTYDTIEDSIEVFSGKKEGYVYTRYGNPTIQAVQDKLALLEGRNLDLNPFCVMCNSGLAAVTTLCLSVLSAGDAMITQGNLYGGTTEIFKKVLSKYGITVHTTDLQDLEETQRIINNNSNIKFLYFETPSNPTLSCLDIEALSKFCESNELISAIDNTFATPFLQQPFKYGIDYIVHSTTKFINGHGNSIAGAILGKDSSHKKAVWETMKLIGTNCNAWDAWLTHNGLKTLAVRIERHCSNALALSQHLENHARVKKVNYPGLSSFGDHDIARRQMHLYGALLSFEIDGDISAGMKFMNNTRICTITSTLGNIDTLLLHPATSSHLNVSKEIREAYNITDGLIRVSVGIEHIDDLIEDVDQALNSL